MLVLKLKMNKEFNYKLKHPWGYREDFEKINDSFSTNEIVEVRDSKNNFISRGYINSNSTIFYRAISFDSRENLENKQKFLIGRLVQCWLERRLSGYSSSCRICFSENDFLPGLILDYFKTNEGQVFVLQILSFGMQNLILNPLSLMEDFVSEAKELKLTNISWANTSVVIRNDSKIREKEGLTVSVPQVLKSSDSINLSESHILIDHFYLHETFHMAANLEDGQKTGFFLDQNYNLLRTAEIFIESIKFQKENQNLKKIRVLDICCFLGQWSVYFGLILKKMGVEAEFVLMDVSSEAIKKASFNLKKYGIEHTAIISDVLEDEFKLDEQSFDLVIVDPPAFIKNKKSLPTGKYAYQKLNSKALPLVKKNGFFVSCSCSGLLSILEFKECLQKTFSKSLRKAKCLAQGGHAADHPFLVNFEEGYYLKMLLHLIS